MVGNMATHRQKWLWKSCWVFYIRICWQQEKSKTLGLAWDFFKPPNQCPSDILPPKRSQFLILLKQCHSLIIKHSHLWTYGGGGFLFKQTQKYKRKQSIFPFGSGITLLRIIISRSTHLPANFTIFFFLAVE